MRPHDSRIARECIACRPRFDRGVARGDQTRRGVVMNEFTLGTFAAFCAGEFGHNIQHGREKALEVAAKIIQAEAKRVIGTYDYNWPQLAESTQADRSKKGFPANEPLLRTGALRDSIHVTIVEPGHIAIVGSDSDNAVYQEFGTSTIPARPFLGGAVASTKKEIRKVVREIVGAAASGHHSVEAEILHIALDALKEIGHDVRDLVEGDEHQQRHGR